MQCCFDNVFLTIVPRQCQWEGYEQDAAQPGQQACGGVSHAHGAGAMRTGPGPWPRQGAWSYRKPLSANGLRAGHGHCDADSDVYQATAGLGVVFWAGRLQRRGDSGGHFPLGTEAHSPRYFSQESQEFPHMSQDMPSFMKVH